MIIYRITNKINGKSYIGQTINSLNSRIRGRLRKNGCTSIHNALKKYEKDNFIIETIEECKSIDELNKKENYFILHFNTLYPNGYNLNTGGYSKQPTEESRKKLSKKIKDFFKKYPEKLEGSKKAFKEIQARWKEEGYHPKRGKKVSEKGRENLSKSKLGDKNPMFGKKPNITQLEALSKGRVKRVMVLCHQNNTIYNGVDEVALKLGLVRSSISNVLTGFRKSLKGYTFEYVKKEQNNE